MRGSVTKRGEGTWLIRYDVGFEIDPATGKKKRKQKAETFYGTKKEAEARLNELVNAVRKGTWVEPSSMTLGEYLNHWLSDCAAPKVGRTTLRGYEQAIRVRIKPALGRLPLQKLNPVHLQQFYADLLRQGRTDGKGGLSPRTIQQTHAVIHQALDDAAKKGLIARNPAALVDLPKQEKREVKALDGDELSTLLRGIDDLRLLVPVALAALTGMRRGEILGLKWEDIDLEAREAKIARTLVRLPREGYHIQAPKTNRSRRRVALPAALVDILKRWRKRQIEERLMAGEAWQDTGLVCTRPTGEPLDPDMLSHGFARLVRRLGLTQITFHGLRHTHATLLLSRNVHPKVVADRLGHSTVKLTLDTYSHAVPGLDKEAARLVDDALRTASENGGRA